jgi:hypothetical protein
MTGSDEESEDRTSETDDGKRRRSPPEEASGSRFDEFLDRLDEREAERERSGEHREERPDTDPEPNVEAAGSDAGRGEGEDTDPETGPDGWVWGSPKASPDSDDTAAEDAEAGQSSEGEPDEASGAGTDRLWNADVDSIDEREGNAEDTPSAPRSDTDDSLEESASRTETGTEAQPAPETGGDDPDETTGTDAPDEPEEREERDRWAELGASLGADEADPPDDPIGAGETADSSQGSKRQADDSGALRPNDRDTTDDTADSDQTGTGSAGTPFPGDGSAAEIDRMTSVPSVLVLGPTGTSVSDAICSRFLTGEEGSRDVLFVTFEEAPDDRIDVCHRAEEWAGGEIGIIEVGRGRRNAAASEITGGGMVGSITVRHVSKPGDLSKLGIVITQLLSKFENTPRRTVLCFHTLSALHNQVGTKTLFRFLNTLGGRLRSADALGHYHMDPDLHDEIVIETLRPIFDSVVRYSADGDFEIE